MTERDSVGAFEYLVLVATLSLRGEGYAVTIREAIERNSGRTVARGALYTTLARLEHKALVRSTFGDATPVRGGRPKRFYELTPAGERAVRATRAELITPWAAAIRRLSGAS